MKRKLIDYKVIECFAPELRGAIMLHVGQGWEPLGGAQPMQVSNWYAQTMVKYEDVKK